MAAYGLESAKQEPILSEMYEFANRMQVGNRTTNPNPARLPFQKGILSNICDLRMLFKKLQGQYDCKYILKYRLNQDPLEMFFGVMRAKGGLYDHPTLLQFKYRLRNYLLGKNEAIVSESSNIAPLDNCDIEFQFVTQVYDLLEVYGKEEFTLNSLTSELFLGREELETQPLTYEDKISASYYYDGLEHLGGYILYRLKRKLGGLDKYSDLEIGFTWTDKLSEGFLNKPNSEFMALLEDLDLIFNNYNTPALSPGPKYIRNLVGMLPESSWRNQ